MVNGSFTPIWEIYGLRSNPFTVFPLSVYGGTLPIEKAFFGREDEIKRLMSYIMSGNSRSIVCGEPGVGKTSFVNYVRSNAMFQGKFFTNFKEIDVQPDWSKEEFLINSLVAIQTTIKLLDLTSKLGDTARKLEALLTLIDSNDRSFSISVAGTGVGGSSTRTISQPQLTETYLAQLFSETVKGILYAGYKGLILHYNNLSVNESEGFSERKIEIFFNNIRDILLTEDTHFIFVTDLNVPSVIESQPRVASTLSGAPILIDPLSKQKTAKVIHKRFEILADKKLAFTPPVDDDAIGVLYDLYDGNIRYVLNSLSEALISVSAEEAPITLSARKTVSLLRGIAQKRILDNLTNRERQVLMAMLSEPESTNKGLTDKLGLQNQNVSTYLKKLFNRGCIYLHHTRSTSKYYRVTEYAKWLLLPPVKTEEGAEKLDKWF